MEENNVKEQTTETPQMRNVREDVPVKDDTRNYGIDALKILSMFMVLVLHIFGHGGILDAAVDNSINYHVSWLMELGAMCAVDAFALITGYLMVNRKWKIGRIIELWLQVAFYSIGITLLYALINPSTFSWKFLIKSIFPVSFKLWWYFTAYFALFFIIPFLNKLLDVLSGRQTIVLCVVLVVLFSVVATFVPGDAFGLGGGYSFLWLAVLYIIGGAIKKYKIEEKVKKRWAALGYLGCWILVWLSRIVIRFLTTKILGYEFGSEMFNGYLSPLVLGMAVSLLLFFSNLKFPKTVNGILKFVSPLSFSVYIIHQQQFVVNQFFVDKWAYLATGNVFALVGTVLLFAIIVFVVCIAIEFIRVQLFKWTRINKGVKKSGDFLDRKIGFYV